MPDSLAGKSAIVTGSSRGIGRAIALAFAAAGARCVITGRDQAAIDAVARLAGPESRTIALDLREPGAAAQLVDFTVKEFGRIDIVVNNAGATRRGDFTALTEEDWQDGFALKFFGAVRVTRAAWPHLQATRGSVLHIAGVGGRTPGPQFALGGSVNAALMALTKSLADAGIAAGIQVNAINPGVVRTARFERRLAGLAARRGIDLAAAEARLIGDENIVRVGEPEEIARLAAFIVGPHGRFLHGSIVDMDGGATKAI